MQQHIAAMMRGTCVDMTFILSNHFGEVEWRIEARGRMAHRTSWRCFRACVRDFGKSGAEPTLAVRLRCFEAAAEREMKVHPLYASFALHAQQVRTRRIESDVL